jgi:YVTN family beta-propeller protein
MSSGFSSAKQAPRRRWAIVVGVFAIAFVPACTNMTTDAQPVLNTVEIPGLAARADAGTEAWVCNFGYDSDPGATVTPVNLSKGVANTPDTTGTLPDAIASSPDGRLVLVADEGQDLLTVIDAEDGDVLARVPTGVEPDAVAVSPDGHLAVVADSDDGTITPVNLKTMRAGRHVNVGHQPDAVAIGGPKGSTALVANLGDGTVTPVDLATMTAGRPIRVGAEPDSIALSPDGDGALVADLGSNSVTYVNMVTLRAGPTIDVGTAPTGIAAEASGQGTGAVAWMTGGTSLVEISFDQKRVIGSAVPVGHLAEAIAVARGSSTAWVADGDPYVTEVNLITRRAIESVRVGGRPTAIVIPAPIG